MVHVTPMAPEMLPISYNSLTSGHDGV